MTYSKKRYRVGIIGLGRVAWELENDPLREKPCTHMGAWLCHKDVEVVAGCDIDPIQLEKFKRQYGIDALYQDYRKMLEIEQLDFVSICAYATERHEMVCQSISAGIKGIWCEKAVATNIAQALDMQKKLQQSECKMIVSYMRRWEDRYHCVQSMLDNKVIGEVESVTTHFSGNMIHTGTHAIDVIRMLMGEITTVHAWLSCDNNIKAQSFDRGEHMADEDSGGFALLHLDSGIIAAVHGENKEYFRFEFELLGSKGMIRIGNTQTELWHVGQSSYSKGLKELKKAEFPDYQVKNLWISASTDLLESVKHNRNVGCGIDDACQNLLIALAMHKSQRLNHKLINLKNDVITLSVSNR